MKIKLIAASLVCVAILAGCAAGNEKIQSLTSTQITQLCIDGKTTLAQLESTLGKHQVMARDKEGVKVYTFNWVRSRPSAKNFIPLNVNKEFIVTRKQFSVWVDGEGVVTKHLYEGQLLVQRIPLMGANTVRVVRKLTQEELDGLVEAKLDDEGKTEPATDDKK